MAIVGSALRGIGAALLLPGVGYAALLAMLAGYGERDPWDVAATFLMLGLGGAGLVAGRLLHRRGGAPPRASWLAAVGGLLVPLAVFGVLMLVEATIGIAVAILGLVPGAALAAGGGGMLFGWLGRRRTVS